MATANGFEIHVKGESEIMLPPERALLIIHMTTQATDESKVTDEIIASARKVETLLRKSSAKVDGQIGAVDYWSRTSLQKSSQEKYDSENKVYLPREHRATVNFELRLQKFARLGSMIHDLCGIEHVQSHGFKWILTAATQEAQRSQLRVLAAQSASSKAQDYAKALGYGKVVAVEMSEYQATTHSSSRKGGMIPTDVVETQSKNMAEIEEWEDVGEESFQYTPEDVKMSQSITARFRAE